MKKLLIFNQGQLKQNTGGSSGYLYILKNYIDNQKINEIELNSIDKSLSDTISFRTKFKSLIKKLTPNIILYFSAYYKIMSKEKYNIAFDNYKGIHFHSSISLYKWKNQEKYNGKILLTSHSPKYYYLELIDDDKVLGNGFVKRTFGGGFKRIDLDAFKKADYLIMPCEEALEIYKSDIKIWNVVEEKKRNNQIKYVPTGLIPMKINKKSDFFSEKNIPKDAFVISFVGRHLPVKGYDLLQKFALNIISNYKNVYFVIAGTINNEYPPLKSEQWIEYGWTNKSLDIIKHSSLFVLPNRQTFFDLVLLEVLSMGTPVLLSDTGGNRYFHKYEDTGLFFFENDNLNEMLATFELLYQYWEKGELEIYGEKNEKLFNSEFTQDSFGERYIKVLKDIDMI
ncbi:glycosyltransferase family 4 protein [Paenibacillus sp. IHBB 3054]|uniref:glycosyltransferase family 4 protein n=1 Tax=Paenibacillus sp. IHBB 3054 TaxID=3425689 RepID=UPI003F67EAFE